jgi:hypothetical protein
MAFDMSLVSGGFNFLNGAIGQHFANEGAEAQAAAANGIRAGQRIVTASNNSRNAQLTAMQRWAQSVRNSRVMESVASHQEALAINFNRARDARTRQNFATNVRQAEEQGRMQAAAASSGVTGSVVDVVNMTAKLRNGMERTARMDAEDQIVYDYQKTEFDTRLALLDQLDFSLILDNPEVMDNGPATEARTGNVLTAGLGNNGALRQITQGLGSFFQSSNTGSSSLDAFLNLNDNFSQKAI